MHPLNLTRHASGRSAARTISPAIIDVILSYGFSRPARDEARKIALSRTSLSEIRRDYGPEFSKEIGVFRSVYVVEASGCVITVARSRKPLFH
jgi:hypothetical protein